MVGQNTASTIIEASDLTASYGETPIWQDASFGVSRGQFIGVLGPNGAGKTTLFRILLGLLQPTGGRLTVFGRQPKRGDMRIGYVPQRRFVDSEMRLEALELVRLGINGTKWGVGGLSKASEERNQALRALKKVDAGTFAHRPVGLLSGGELQRVLLAQALVSQPDLLLLDEPLANLDIRRQAELVRLIDDIVRKDRVSVLLIAHDINPLLPVLDR